VVPAVFPLAEIAAVVAVVAVAAAIAAIAVLLAVLLILLLAGFLFGGQLALRLGQHPGVMLGVLQEVLGRHAVVRQLGVARQHVVFLDDLLRRSAHLALGTRGIEDAVDDVAEGARAVLVGTRAFLGRAHLVLMMALACGCAVRVSGQLPNLRRGW